MPALTPTAAAIAGERVGTNKLTGKLILRLRSLRAVDKRLVIAARTPADPDFSSFARV
jgi:hypothetical protein